MAGRKINDHSSWIGSGTNGSVFPEGVKVKMDSSANGAGELNEYCDTTDKIKQCQDMGKGKINSNSMKPGYRQ